MPEQVATQARPAAAPPRTGGLPAVRDVAMSDRGVSLTSWSELRQCAADLIKGIGSKDTPEVAMVKIQAGAELGVSAIRSMSLLTVINGRVGIMGELVLALIRRDGKPKVLNLGNDGEGDARCGWIETQREGGPLVRSEFSIAEAKRAGLMSKDTYRGYPDDMLLWRAVGRHGKRYWSDVLMGFEVAETAHEGHGTLPARVIDRPAVESAGPDPLLTETIDAETVPDDRITETTLAEAVEARREEAVTNQPPAQEKDPLEDEWAGVLERVELKEVDKRGEMTKVWYFHGADETIFASDDELIVGLVSSFLKKPVVVTFKAQSNGGKRLLDARLANVKEGTLPF